MVAVHNIVFIIEFVEIDWREQFSFTHGLFDTDQAIPWHVTLEREITVKCVAFPDTTDNLVEQNPANTTVRK